jgi:hypothetical protein
MPVLCKLPTYIPVPGMAITWLQELVEIVYNYPIKLILIIMHVHSMDILLQ